MFLDYFLHIKITFSLTRCARLFSTDIAAYHGAREVQESCPPQNAQLI
jgi:hypothetical protein